MKQLLFLLLVVSCASCGSREKMTRVKDRWSERIVVRMVDSMYKIGDTINVPNGLDGDEGDLFDHKVIVLSK